MSNLKEKFEQVINENVNPVSAYGIEGQDKAASACVSVVIDMLVGMREDHLLGNKPLDVFGEQISQLKSLIQ